MIVWCSIFVIVNCFSDDPKAVCMNETAAKGFVLSETKTHYTVDFSDYAKEKGYEGDYSLKVVDKDNCMKAD